MVTGLDLLFIIIILYFAARVNRIERRMNLMEAHFNRHLRDGSMEESHTFQEGKAFRDKGTLSENLKDVATEAKAAVSDMASK